MTHCAAADDSSMLQLLSQSLLNACPVCTRVMCTYVQPTDAAAAAEDIAINQFEFDSIDEAIHAIVQQLETMDQPSTLNQPTQPPAAVTTVKANRRNKRKHESFNNVSATPTPPAPPPLPQASAPPLPPAPAPPPQPTQPPQPQSERSKVNPNKRKLQSSDSNAHQTTAANKNSIWTYKYPHDSPFITWVDGAFQYTVQNPNNCGKTLLKLQLFNNRNCMINSCGIYFNPTTDRKIMTTMNTLTNQLKNLWVDPTSGCVKHKSMNQSRMQLCAWRKPARKIIRKSTTAAAATAAQAEKRMKNQ